MKQQGLLQAYRLIRKNRRIRKMQTYKLALSVVIDKTTAFYLLILAVYGIFGFYIANDFIHDHHGQFLIWEGLAKQYIGTIFTILPLGYLLQSFKNPGIIFSSSEYHLSVLPFSRKKIWLLTSIHKWLKQFIVLFILGGLIVLLTPLSFNIIFAYLAIAMFFNIAMTVPQWKMFQARLYIKIGWLFIFLLLNGINFSLQLPIIPILITILLIIGNILLIPRLFHQVQWDRVTEISDFQIWSMWFVSKVSEVDLKPPKKLSILRNLSRRKKPFRYEEKSVHHRLWSIYLWQHRQDLFRIIGALFIFVFVFSWLDEWVFHIILIVAIYVYFSIVRSFFIGRFEADLVQVLPWNLLRFKASFFKWAVYGFLILFIPVGIYFITNASYWLPVQILYLMITFFYLYQATLDKAIGYLNKQAVPTLVTEVIGYLLLIGWAFSWKVKFVLLLGILLPLIKRIWLIFQPNFDH